MNYKILLNCEWIMTYKLIVNFENLQNAGGGYAFPPVYASLRELGYVYAMLRDLSYGYAVLRYFTLFYLNLRYST